MSNSFKNPLVPVLDNPVNLDRPIQELQLQLAEMGWLEKCFGRAHRAIKSSQGSFNQRRVLVYPQVWQGPGKDLLEVLPNDNLVSQCFFSVDDPVEVIEYVPDSFSMMRARVSAIFWFDLKRIDRTKDYNFTEELKAHAQRVITTSSLSNSASVAIARVWDTPANVFRGYDINELKDQELVYPRGGFRIEMELTYMEDCPGISV